MKSPALFLQEETASPLKAVPQWNRLSFQGSSPAKVYSLKSLKELVKQFVCPLQPSLPEDVERDDQRWYNHYE